MTEDVKYLDLDALAPKAVFKIKLDGKDHEMKQMTVEDFVWASKIAQEKGEEIEADDVAGMIDAMLDVLCRQFPTVKREQFQNLGFERLVRLLQFTRDLGEQGAEGVLAKAAEEGKVDLEPSQESQEATPAQ